ncbi:hypothetical protein [Deinococcus wulumuqiensis]|nr:hypothetical protein [Deinococcus wulumuqiensis]QII20009.1 hypothetical protein G6R31_03985 [Deinococcus wulumuqiensis R12]
MSGTKIAPFFQADDIWESKLVCPACGYDYNHVLPHPFNAPGHDQGAAGWGGRGDLYTLPVWGECGHVWGVQFGFHKGQTFLMAGLLTAKELEYDEALAFVKAQGKK